MAAAVWKAVHHDFQRVSMLYLLVSTSAINALSLRYFLFV
jgi:hypothetical protein